MAPAVKVNLTLMMNMCHPPTQQRCHDKLLTICLTARQIQILQGNSIVNKINNGTNRMQLRKGIC